MKHRQMVDPDLEVIGMVNDGVAGRQRVREGRALLARMSKEQAQAEKRKAAWWRAFRSMAVEAGTFAVAGVAVLAAMSQGLIDPKVSIPVFVLCMLWTAIRIDRFVRR